MKNKTRSDKNKAIPRFTLIDAVIILVIIVAVVGIYFRHNIVEFFSDTSDMKEYTVSYSIENIRYTTPDYIEVGDKLYFSDSGDELGTIINESENMGALSIKVASQYMTDSTGKIIDVPYPNETRVDATGRFSCVGKYYDNGGFLVDGSEYIAPGNIINVQTETVTFSIMILDISETAQEISE